MGLQSLQEATVIESSAQKSDESARGGSLYWSVNHAGQGLLSIVKQYLTGKSKQTITDRLLAEEHHRSYGRAWLLGNVHFEFLLSEGLTSHQNVLEFGCGSGRLGVHLIQHLDNQRYCGIDSHYQSLYAFANYEATLNKIHNKQFRLLHDDSFSFDFFNKKFDVIVDSFVSKHLSHEHYKIIARKASQSLNESGRYYLNPVIPDFVKELEAQGFKGEEISFRYEFLEHSFHDVWLRLTR